MSYMVDFGTQGRPRYKKLSEAVQVANEYFRRTHIMVAITESKKGPSHRIKEDRMKCMECGYEFENEELFVFEDSNCTKVLCLGCLASHFKTVSEKEADEYFKEWLKELKK